ncbi:MAG: class I SAM-dependent methyltransferase [Armatimonadetes bacterium]|nr:class I SAM-dependent methyltransferase [Armatimonadota bacterium]
MGRQWFEGYFDEWYLPTHGDGLGRAPAEVDYIVGALDLPPDSAVLDLACGHGRHAVELARRGYRVTGLDLSRVLLAKAEELARERGVAVELVEEDMRRIPETWAARFEGAINVFTAWGYFEKEADNERVIEGVARSLRLGGRFLLDVINREWVIRHFRDTQWSEEADGILALERTTFDLRKSRSESVRTFVLPDGRRFARDVSVRLYTLAEVEAAFARHHLEIKAVSGGWTGEEYTMDSRRMIVVAERMK